MRALHIALRDLLETFRDVQALLFMVAMPVAFTLFYGAVFNFGDADPRISIGYLNQDRGALTQTIEEFLNTSQTIRPEPLDISPDEAGALVRQEKQVAVLIIPQGFSEEVLSGRDVSMRLIVDENTPDGRTVVSALGALSTRLQATVGIVQVSLVTREEQRPFADPAERQAFVGQALADASKGWQQPAMHVTMEQPAGEDDVEVPTGFSQSSPGMLVQFAIFGLIGPVMLIVAEQSQGTLRRLLTTSVARWQMVGGHMLSILATIFAQQLLMILVGQLFLGVDYWRAPLATLIMMLAVCLFSSGLGMLIAVISKSEEQVTTYTIIIALLLSALGGAWFPLDITGTTFARIGHVFPTAWAMDGFQNIIVRGLGLTSVLPSALILLGYGVVLFGVAVWRMRAT